MKISVVTMLLTLMCAASSFAQPAPTFGIRAISDVTGNISFDLCQRQNANQQMGQCQALTDKSYKRSDLVKLQLQADSKLRQEIQSLNLNKKNPAALTISQKWKLGGLVLLALVIAAVGGLVGLFVGAVLEMFAIQFLPNLVLIMLGAGGPLVLGGSFFGEIKSNYSKENAAHYQNEIKSKIPNYAYYETMSNLLDKIDLPQDDETRLNVLKQLQAEFATIPSYPREYRYRLDVKP